MSADQIEVLFALGIGFAVAGLIATAYQLITRRPAGFGELHQGSRLAALAAVPMLVFAAPYIIMRAAIRAAQADGQAFMPVMVATIVAGGWSLMCGTMVVSALAAFGLPAAW
jgi:hypothetical protein